MDSTPRRPGTGEHFDALRHGIFQRFLDKSGNELDTRVWNSTVGTGEFVGTCRNCGHQLIPDPTQQIRHITWYTAHCINRLCDHTIAAPNGQIIRRSSRYTEQPTSHRPNKTSRPTNGL